MKTYCITLILLTSLSSRAQPAEMPCWLDTNLIVELNHHILYYSDLHPDSIRQFTSVKCSSECYFQESQALCDPISAVYDEKFERFRIFQPRIQSGEAYSEPDTVGLLINWDKVRSVNISIRGQFDNPHDTAPLDLSKIDFIQQLNNVELDSIYIHSYNARPFLINLSSWPVYKQLKKSKSLKYMHIDAQSFLDKNLKNQLVHFSNLETLIVSDNFNSILTKLPKLKYVRMTGDTYFQNNIALLPSLERYFCIAVTNYAITSFYLNSVHSAMNADYAMDLTNVSDIKHPVAYMDSLIELYAPEKFVDSGAVIVLCSDLAENCFWGTEDTLAAGKMLRGEKVGTWRYMLLNQGIFLSDPIFMDHSNPYSAVFPKNGLWEYNYLNGNVGISGKFKRGLKEGEWRFYELNGDLIVSLIYHKDRLVKN